MYCPHCAKHIDENKIEASSSSYQMVSEADKEIAEDATIGYVCPRCGHLIHEGLDAEDEFSAHEGLADGGVEDKVVGVQ